jgi:glycosyltransferase involved in cell wall biosynthesis
VHLFLKMGFKVIFLPDSMEPLAPYTSELQQLGVEVIYGSINFEKWLAKNGKYLYYVWLARPQVSIKYIDLLKKFTNSRLLYYTHDLHFLRERRHYEFDPAPRHLFEAQQLKNQEFQIFSKVDVILTPSNYEEQIIRDSFPSKKVVTIPPYFYDFPLENAKIGDDFANREGILFLGGFGHNPNVDAVLWFVEEILPRVKNQIPEVTFTVAGSNPTQEILALQNDNLQVTGYVPDLGPLFKKARVFVAPLRYGAGVKGKIITSLVEGVPVVTTSIGNEGLNFANGQEAFVADDPETFAAQTVELYTNQALWERLAKNGQDYLQRHFSSENAQWIIQEILFGRQCPVCGHWFYFVPSKSIENLREAHVCDICGALYRMVQLAKAILEVMGLEKFGSLKQCFGELVKRQIYELGAAGPIHQILSSSPNFVFSEYFEDTLPGTIHKSGVRCEDIQNLSFEDGSFDLIISQDVLEHVPDPTQGLNEIYRVLRPGGYHIFTVPFDKSLEKSVTRARVESGAVNYILPPIYHGDPIRKAGALVYTDFGHDFLNILKTTGFEVSLRETSNDNFRGGYTVVFISKK